jgi:DNA replication protein DnaT
VKMNVSWRPDADLFEQLCQLVGVIDKGYSADELGEYIAYWLGYPEKQFTDYQWTQKFVLNIKQRRQRLPVNKEQTKVGHQWITPQAGIEIDDNVKQLVEKYSGKS